MDTVAQLLFLDLTAQIGGHFNAGSCGQTLHALFLALCRCGSQLGDLIIRNRDARYVFIHVLRHARGLQRDDASHDVHLDVGLFNLIHELLQRFHGEDALRLHVLRARVYLLLQLVDLQEDGFINGRYRRALIEVRRSGQRVATAIGAGFFHLGQHAQNAQRIQIEYGLGALAIANHGMIAGQRQHGIDAKRGCGQHIAHDRHAGTIAAGHLNDGFQTRVLQRDAEAQRGSLQGGGLHIGYVHAVYDALQALCNFHFMRKIAALRRSHFRGDTKYAIFKSLFKNAHAYTSFDISRVCGQLRPSQVLSSRTSSSLESWPNCSRRL